MNESEPVGFSLLHLSKSFAGRQGGIDALDQVSFSVQAGEFVCLVGPSGCGKSTLLRLIAGLVEPSRGKLTFSNAGSPRVGGAPPRNAMVFQEHGLFPWMTVTDNVAFGLEAQGVPRPERRRKAGQLLEQIGLSAFGMRYPHELSVGMRQRAAIARAFLVNPQLLLMDEPFSALDAQSKLVMQEELLRLWKDHPKTVVYVTHDIEESVLLADRVLVMSGRPGRILEEIPIPLGRPRDLHDRDQPQVREITWHIWKAIEGQVRQNLYIPSPAPSSV
jgi:NitT/TauT family transport system ATP-binding protein